MPTLLTLCRSFARTVCGREVSQLCPGTPHQLQLKYTLTVYQRPSRLEITLQAPMPTLVQLSTVGRPLFQGNHKLHVMEAFRLGRQRQPYSAVLSTNLLVHPQAV